MRRNALDIGIVNRHFSGRLTVLSTLVNGCKGKAFYEQGYVNRNME